MKFFIFGTDNQLCQESAKKLAAELWLNGRGNVLAEGIDESVLGLNYNVRAVMAQLPKNDFAVVMNPNDDHQDLAVQCYELACTHPDIPMFYVDSGDKDPLRERLRRPNIIFLAIENAEYLAKQIVSQVKLRQKLDEQGGVQ